MRDTQAHRLPWTFTRPGIFTALLIVYPLGLVWLIKSPRPRRWEKRLAAIGFFPLFLLIILFALKPFWDFGGGLNLSGFRIDWTKGRLHFRKLEAHRTRQHARPSAPSSQPDWVSELSWPAFRGTDRDGKVSNSLMTFDWNQTMPRELWRQPVGLGYAGFVLGGGRAFTIEQRRDFEVVTCYDAATGEQRWAYSYSASFQETLGGNGPRATPTLDGDHLYALGAEGDLHCLDAMSGKPVWHRNILTEFSAENLSWGMSAAPLVFNHKVVVTSSGKGVDSIVAMAAATGKIVWKTDAGQQAYSSPMLVTLAGRPQILNLAAYQLNGIDPETGHILWQFPWKTQYGINCSQPVLAGENRIFLSSGYGHGCALIRIESVNGSLQPHLLWANVKMKNKFASSVIYDGFIYGLNERVLVCLDLETGERRWKGRRYDYGSILLVEDHLLVLGERGRLALIKADPRECVEIGSIQILHDRTWNNFCVAGGLLFARNHKEMVCYDLRTGSFPSTGIARDPPSHPKADKSSHFPISITGH